MACFDILSSRAVGMPVGVFSRKVFWDRRGADGDERAVRSNAHQQMRQGELRLHRLFDGRPRVS